MTTDFTCAICLETWELTVATSLPCSHTFHAACIDGWFQHEGVARKPRSCPVCRTVFLDVNPGIDENARYDIRQLTRFFAIFHLLLFLFEVAVVLMIDLHEWLPVIQLPISRLFVACITIRQAISSTKTPMVLTSLLALFPSQCLAILYTYRDSLAFAIVEPILSICYLLFHWILLSEWNVNNL